MRLWTCWRKTGREVWNTPYLTGNVHAALLSKPLGDYSKVGEAVNPHKNVMLVCLFTQLVIRSLHKNQNRWGEHAHLLRGGRLGRPTKSTRLFQTNKNSWLRFMFYSWLTCMAEFQKIICLTLQAHMHVFGPRWPWHLLTQQLRNNFLQPWYTYSIYIVAHSSRYSWEI